MTTSASWFERTELTRLQRCALRVLRAGAVPRHIAFIMDGNRRYARKCAFRSVLDGHAKGFEQLGAALKWCRDFGVEYVTVYAFSLENFKRKREEVDGLLRLARQKFIELLQERQTLADYGVRFRFFGDLTQLPVDLQRLIAEIELTTEEYDKANVNVCLAYTAQDEMARAAKNILRGVEHGLLEPDDISEDLVSRCLDSGECPDPDLLVRTSGEMRMSDFLLWQSSYSCLYFDKVLWPEFSFWHLCYAILHYQWYCAEIQVVRDQHLAAQPELSEEQQHRIDAFLTTMREQRRAHRRNLIKEQDVASDS